MKPDFELGDDSEVPAASAARPTEVQVLSRAATLYRAIGCNEGETFNIVAGHTESSRQPSCASAQYQSGSAGVRHHAGRKNQPCLLRCIVNRSKETTPGEAGEARLGIYGDMAHLGKVDHQTTVASAETRETVTATPHRAKNSA